VHRSPSEGREDGLCGPPRRAGKVYMLWWCMKMQGDEYLPASALCLMYDTLRSLHVSYRRMLREAVGR